MSIERCEVKLKTLPHFKNLPLPAYQSQGAVGMDLYAACDAPLVLLPHQRALIPTGICVSLPEGFEAQIRPRSGLAIKHGIGLLNAPGTIDSDYRGEIKIIVINLGDDPFTIERGLRIAQMVVGRFARANVKVASELDVTYRNEGGFGHTGFHIKNGKKTVEERTIK